MANKFADSINKLGYNTLDLWRKVFFIFLSGFSLFINLLLRPRILLLYKDSGVNFSSETIYISYIAIVVMLILAFVPLKKDTVELFKNFIISIVLGLVLLFLAMSSVIVPIYTLLSTLQ